MTNRLTELKLLLEHLDLKRIMALTRNVDLGKLLRTLSELELEDLADLASQVRAKHRNARLPEANGDSYGLRPQSRPLPTRTRCSFESVNS